MLLIALLLAGDIPAPQVRMADLYDRLCLRAFPDDGAVERAVLNEGGTPLSDARVRDYLRADPGRGWRIERDGSVFTVLVEAPPYHACSVRLRLDREPDSAGPYAALAAAYARDHRLEAMPPFEGDFGTMHARAAGYQRIDNDGGAESLFYLVNTPKDPATAPDTGAVEIRYVHQLAAPGAH